MAQHLALQLLGFEVFGSWVSVVNLGDESSANGLADLVDAFDGDGGTFFEVGSGKVFDRSAACGLLGVCAGWLQVDVRIDGAALVVSRRVVVFIRPRARVGHLAVRSILAARE